MTALAWAELASLGTASLWAVASLVFARLTQRTTPIALNLLKCGVSAPLLVVTALVVDGAPPPVDVVDLARIAATAVLGLALADTLYFRALSSLGPRQAPVLIALVPPATALAAAAVLDEPLTGAMVGGMALTLFGVAVVVRARTGDDEGAPIDDAARRGGLLAGFGYVACQAASNVCLKGVSSSWSAASLTAARLTIGLAVLVVVLAGTRRLRDAVRSLAPRAVLAPGLAATISGTYVGLWLGVYGVRHAPVGIATTLSATTPLFVLAIERARGETIAPRALLGALLAVVGVAVLFAGA